MMSEKVRANEGSEPISKVTTYIAIRCLWRRLQAMSQGVLYRFLSVIAEIENNMMYTIRANETAYKIHYRLHHGMCKSRTVANPKQKNVNPSQLIAISSSMDMEKYLMGGIVILL